LKRGSTPRGTMSIKKRKTLSRERVHALLLYEKANGVFIWRDNRRSIKAGSVAGCISKQTGNRNNQIDGKSYPASHVVWLYETGALPTGELDHKNRVRHEDFFDNLREISSSGNKINQTTRKDSTLGVTGVHRDGATEKFRVKMKGKTLGAYKSIYDAACHRYCMELKNGFTKFNAESSARQYITKHSTLRETACNPKRVRKMNHGPLHLPALRDSCPIRVARLQKPEPLTAFCELG
jgi:hypothetical protein